MSDKMTLRAFMELLISEEDWLVWERVKDERPPLSKVVFSDDGLGRSLTVTEMPSDFRLQKVELMEKFTDHFHNQFFDGTWEATARRGSQPREKLEKYDFDDFRIEPKVLSSNGFGHFTHIEISQVRSSTSEEILRRFIEKVCNTLVPNQSMIEV